MAGDIFLINAPNQTLQIDLKTLLILVCHGIVALGCWYFSSEIGFGNNSIKYVASVAVIVFGWCVISFVLIGGKWSSPYFSFLVFYFIFLFGQIVVRALCLFDDPDLIEVIDLFSEDSITNAGVLAMIGLLSIHLGALLFYHGKSSKAGRDFNFNDPVVEAQTLKWLGWIVTLFCSVPALVGLAIDFRLAKLSGYSGVYSDFSYGPAAIIERMADYFFIGLMCLVVFYRNNRCLSKLIFLFGLSYSFVQIFLGARGTPLLRVLALIWLWHKAIRPIKMKTVWIGILTVIPGSALLALLRVLRNFPMSEWLTNLPNLMVDFLGANPLLKVLNEMGTAIGPTAAAIQLCPQSLPHAWGKSYLYSVLMIIPNLSGTEINQFVTEANVSRIIGEATGCAFGGSLVGEAFYNFGWFSGFFMILIGGLLAGFSNWTEKTGKFQILIFQANFLVIILWTIRNSLSSIPRGIVYYFLLPNFIYYTLFSIIKKRLSRKV